MRWCVLAVSLVGGCAEPVLPDAAPPDLFDGGDDLAVSEDRVLRGTILEDLTLDAEAPWTLDGLVFVGDGQRSVDLTIEPGAVIYGNPTTRGTLVVARGSRMLADGAPGAPIVFTSPRARGARRAGDWGGLVINGRAPVNACDSPPCEREGEGSSGLYGGNDPEDDSGVLRYVRVEFAGALYDVENELNGIAFQGVGRGTVVDHVQVHVTSDDGVEFFGGTVDVRHVVVTGAGDDSMDWTGGWQGRAQHVVLQAHPGRGDRGIEADNDEFEFDATPRSSPTIANVTLVGQAGSTTAMNFRRGTAVRLYNSVVTGYATCVDIDDDATWDSGYAAGGSELNGSLLVAGTWLNCASTGSSSAWESQTVASFLALNEGVVLDDPLLEGASDPDSPDFQTGSSALASGALPLADAFFDDTSHVGAVGPDDWTTGWTQGGTD